MKRKIWMKLTAIMTAALLVTGVTGISMTSYAAESTEEQTDLASVDLALSLIRISEPTRRV